LLANYVDFQPVAAPKMSAKILIVDDERNVRLTYRAALESCPYEIYEADCGRAALAESITRKPDLAILDLRMPDMYGIELLTAMRNMSVETPAIIITAYGDIPNAVLAMKQGAIDFLQKPILPEELRNIVKDVLLRHQPETEAAKDEPPNFNLSIRRAKRAINLQDFPTARKHLADALESIPNSPVAFNLAGVMHEIQKDYDQAKRCYGQAIRLDKDFEPAQQNMRRIFELFNFGSSEEQVNMEAK
jgi:FixJ family two-component response regulator